MNRASQERGPLSLRLVTFGSALLWFVRVEPAPVDVVYGLFTAAQPLRRGTWTPASVVWVTLSLALAALNAVGLIASEASLRFGAITIYLLLFGAALASLRYPVVERAEHALLFATKVTALVVLASAGFLYVGNGRSVQWFRDWLMDSGRVSGFYKDPNVAGPFLVVGLVILVDRAVTRSAPSRRTWLWVGILALAVIATFSRGAVLNAAAALFALTSAYAACGRWRAVRLAVSRGAAVGVLAILLLVIAAPRVGQSRALHLLNSYDTGRVGAWEGGLAAALRAPLGYGPGSFEFVAARFAPPDAVRQAHETYLRVLVENGWMGLVLYGALLIWAMVCAWSVRRDRGWLFAVLLGIVVESFIIDTEHWRHLFLVAGLAVHLASIRRTISIRAGGLARTVKSVPSGNECVEHGPGTRAWARWRFASPSRGGARSSPASWNPGGARRRRFCR